MRYEDIKDLERASDKIKDIMEDYKTKSYDEISDMIEEKKLDAAMLSIILKVKDNIRKISEEKGLGVLITDHNPKATLSITDRAYVIFDGKIKIQGKSEEVAVNPVAKEFYLGKDFTL